MKVIYLYSSSCTSCGAHGNLIRNVRTQAHKAGYTMQIRGTRFNQGNAKFAKEVKEKYGIDQPFVWNQELDKFAPADNFQSVLE